MLRRANSVGHASREALMTAVKHLQIFILTKGELARTAVDIDSKLLCRFAQWLGSDESGLSYRTGASVFRAIVPAVRLWVGREWAATGLVIPRHQFPDLHAAPKTGPSKGYTEEELHQIASCVLSDIASHDAQKYEPTYLGQPEPLEGVALNSNDSGGHGDKWTNIDYRTWWWEENCDCRILTVKQLRSLPRGYSFIFGKAYENNDRSRDQRSAEVALASFYELIGAGPGYVRRHLKEPVIYRTKWSKFEYVHWYFDNHCEHRWIPHAELKRTHKKLLVALREHHGGIESFYRRIGLEKQYPTADFLCPYYVGLLLTTSFNPSTVQKLSMDCVVRDVIDGQDSIAWTKLRAARTGLSIPTSSVDKLAPRNLVEKILALTKPFRGTRKHLFALASPKPQRANLPPNKCVFQRAIKKWFERHGIAGREFDGVMGAPHAATNFRPAVAKMAYEKTGDILYVQALLNHRNVSTTSEYIGQIPKTKLVGSVGIHIEAIFADVTGDESSSCSTHHKDIPVKNWTETTVAHCSDIWHSPWPGQRQGTPCELQQACLSCQNLVITHKDIMRHFAAKAYYQARVLSGKITKDDVEAELGLRFHIFEEQIIPRYPKELILSLAERAVLNPPPEYRP